MERAIEVLAAISFLVIGESHIVQHRAWADLFTQLHSLLIGCTIWMREP